MWQGVKYFDSRPGRGMLLRVATLRPAKAVKLDKCKLNARMHTIVSIMIPKFCEVVAKIRFKVHMKLKDASKARNLFYNFYSEYNKFIDSIS